MVLLDRLGFGQVNWSVVTSAHTVEALQRLRARLLGRAAAVGKATATALETVGCAVDFTPWRVSAAGILEEFPVGTGRVVIPGSALSKLDLPEGLRELDRRIEVSPVYTMGAAQEPAELAARWRAEELAAVIVTVGSAARVIDERLGWPKETRVLAIRQPTVKVLNELGVAASVSSSPEAEAVARTTAEPVGKRNI